MKSFKKIFSILFISILFFSSCGPQINQVAVSDLTMDIAPMCGLVSSKVVYGTDDRKDLYQTTDKLRELSRSTAALVAKSSLINIGDGNYTHRQVTLGDSQNLCDDQKYSEQYDLAFCSGFLVSSNVMVTAGHCIVDQATCNNTKVVFDFSIENESDVNGPEFISGENVYTCSSIIDRVKTDSGADYAVVYLDRHVEGRIPLKVRTTGLVGVGMPVAVIGNPSGVPTKIADNAIVRGTLEDHFITNLDTFAGNSGSPIINTHTMTVEGILVRGDSDYNYDEHNQCYIVNQCSDYGCTGEEATRITSLSSALSIVYLYNEDGGPNSCRFANDGVCDDGRIGASFAACSLGTDENDCSYMDPETCIIEAY